jgi:hypothetical protein
MNGWVLVRNSTCTTRGSRENHCLNCDYFESEDIPLERHDFVDDVCDDCGIEMYEYSFDDVYGHADLKRFNGYETAVIPDEVNGVKVVAVAANAFKRSDIESVVIPATVKVIGAEAFFSCTSLKSVVIGAGVEFIGENAFFGCFRLTTVTISSDVKTIGANAFGSCYKLATVYYDGTAAEWAAIVIGENNEKLTGAQIIFN